MTKTIEEIKVLKVARVKCQRSLLFATRYFFKKRYNRKFVIGRHHQIIATALEKVLRGEITKLIINLAPRYGKTELAVKNLIPHGLSLNPAAKFIHLTYADKLALDNSEEAREIVQSEEYQELFPEVQIKKNSDAKNKWYTTVGGGVYAAAAGGQVTGFGAGQVDEEEDEEIAELNRILDELEQKQGFGGAIIIDDPIKPEDASSEVKRERVNNRFESTIRNRVNSRNTPIIVIGQRVHPKDLSGYLIDVEPDEWVVISLPCLYYDEEGQKQSLWEFKHTVGELEKLERINPFVYQTQYQQNPRPLEGLLFPEQELMFYEPEDFKVEDVEYTMAFGDPADKGGDNFSVPYGFVIGEYVYVHEVIFSKDGVDIVMGEMVERTVANKVHELIIEGNSGWHLIGKQVRQQLGERARHCRTMIINATANKETRILAQSGFIKNHMRFRKDYKQMPQYHKFMQNMFDYQKEGKNDHDDAPDSLAGLAFMLQRNIPHHFNS